MQIIMMSETTNSTWCSMGRGQVGARASGRINTLTSAF